jgi:hypothetical protein
VSILSNRFYGALSYTHVDCEKMPRRACVEEKWHVAKMRGMFNSHRRQPTYRRNLLSLMWQVIGLEKSGDYGQGRVGVGCD